MLKVWLILAPVSDNTSLKQWKKCIVFKLWKFLWLFIDPDMVYLE